LVSYVRFIDRISIPNCRALITGCKVVIPACRVAIPACGVAIPACRVAIFPQEIEEMLSGVLVPLTDEDFAPKVSFESA
jgi:hypothetical protein